VRALAREAFAREALERTSRRGGTCTAFSSSSRSTQLRSLAPRRSRSRSRSRMPSSACEKYCHCACVISSPSSSSTATALPLPIFLYRRYASLSYDLPRSAPALARWTMLSATISSSVRLVRRERVGSSEADSVSRRWVEGLAELKVKNHCARAGGGSACQAGEGGERGGEERESRRGSCTNLSRPHESVAGLSRPASE